jgi:type IV secretion system protein VirD4
LKQKTELEKKPNIILPIIFLCLGIIVLYIGSALGYAMDKTATADGKFEIAIVGNELGETISQPFAILRKINDKKSFTYKVTFTTGMAIILFTIYKFSIQKKKLHKKGIEHGSAKWGDANEAKQLEDIDESTKKPREMEYFPVKNVNGKRIFDENGEIIYMCVDNNILFTKEVKMSLDTRQHRENLNVLIIGGSGSGKTRFYAKPNIMQLNTSYVITDPKGEILQSTGKMLTEAGYEVKVFNLINMKNSNNYNPFHYVYDFEGNLGEDKVIKMIDVLLKNTKGEGDKDDFWSLMAGKLLKAIVFLLFEQSEYNAKINPETGLIFPETRDLSNLNMFSVGEKLREISYPPSGQEEGFQSELDIEYEELESKKPGTIASMYYKEFRIAPAETGQSIVSTANARTQMFNLKSIADLTCTDTLKLNELGDRKTALFVIIPSSDTTFNFLAAMMYTQMFDSLYERANFKYGGRLPIHVRCILDEFANIGQIPNFDNLIATMRSMEISVNVIIQTIAQLKAKYEKTYDIIMENCDSLLFLGGKGVETVKNISEMLGKETLACVKCLP